MIEVKELSILNTMQSVPQARYDAFAARIVYRQRFRRVLDGLLHELKSMMIRME
jgi:hypothetical protein